MINHAEKGINTSLPQWTCRTVELILSPWTGRNLRSFSIMNHLATSIYIEYVLFQWICGINIFLPLLNMCLAHMERPYLTASMWCDLWMRLLIPWERRRTANLWKNVSWTSTFKGCMAVFTVEPSGKVQGTLQFLEEFWYQDRKGVFHEEKHQKSLESCITGRSDGLLEQVVYSWIIHSSIDAMKVVERIILIHMVKIANYFTYKITNAKAAIYFKCGNLGIYPWSSTQN